jgi:hypothetical protein
MECAVNIGREDIVDTAHLKLTNGEPFNDQNEYHVLAVVSQRHCVDFVSVYGKSPTGG